MQELDIKRGCFSNIEGDKLKNMMKEVFGNVKEDGGFLASNYLAMNPIKVKLKGKNALIVDITTKAGLPEDDNMKTIVAKNKFLEAATGFTSKERSKRLQKKAKQGKV